jgi:hypothetical protein
MVLGPFTFFFRQTVGELPTAIFINFEKVSVTYVQVKTRAIRSLAK